VTVTSLGVRLGVLWFLRAIEDVLGSLLCLCTLAGGSAITV
jgi:hypothetical protein